MHRYYVGSEVVITETTFIQLRPRREFAIEELTDVHRVRGDLHPSRVLCSHAAGLSLLAVAASWPLIDTPAALIAATIAVAMPSLLGTAAQRLSPRVQELRANYRGMRVVLFSSSDQQVFGQVQRAMVRAMENLESARM